MRLALVALVIAGALAVGAAAATRPSPQIAGEDPITGKQFALSSFKGHVVVVNVWASWCTGCEYEAAHLRRFAQKHPDVRMLGIDYDDTRTAARKKYRGWGWTWPVVFDPKGKWRNALKAPGLPTTIFLNRRHEIVGGIVGAGTPAQFEAGLRVARQTP